jgi:CAAX prenyl protease-like protein
MSERHDKQTVGAGSSTAAVPAPGLLQRNALIRAALARVVPFAVFIFFLVVTDLLAWLGVAAATLRWLYPLQIGAVLALLLVLWRQYDELHGLNLPLPQALVATATGIGVTVLWVLLDDAWMIAGSGPGYDPRVDGRIDPLLAALRRAGAALVVPVMEELFWRSFLMRWIEGSDFRLVDPARIGVKAFVIPTLLFGVEHHLWLAGVVAGGAYGLLYLRHRNLFSPVLGHAVTNGLLGIWVLATGDWAFW